MKKWIPIILLICIVLFGFWFRIQGIIDNHSFWADEAYVSSFARNIVQGKTSIIQGISVISYESLQILITAVSFKLFGISEFTARLPSVVFGTIGIIFAFLISRRLSNWSGGLLAAFLYAFSTLNLAHSTQAKPYTTIQTILLIVVFLLLKIRDKHISKNQLLIFHSMIFLLASFATYIHISGVLIWFIYGFFVVYKYKKNIILFLYNPVTFIFFLVCLLFFLYIFKIGHELLKFLEKDPNSGKFFIYYNHLPYFKSLFLKQYVVFLIPTLLAIFLCIKKHKEIIIGIFLYIASLMFMWNFRGYTHNIRYVVPFFGIIFVFFGVFWGKIGEYISRKSPLRHGFEGQTKVESLKLLPLIVIIILIVTQYKIYFPLTPNSYRLTPRYFSPNTDFYGDVQTADYKTTYGLIRKNIPDYRNIAIFNDLPDAHRWYMPEKNIDAYFMKSNNKEPEKNSFDEKIIYKTLDQFLTEKAKYQKGLLIVEDWESFLPEDIKQNAKKNMKRVIRVKGLKETPNDPWPLEVYMWNN